LIKFTDLMGVIALNEASFNEKKLDKVVSLLASLASKKIGKLTKLGKVEKFSNNKTGNGKGYRYITDDGTMIRFNWLKTGKKSKFMINSVDYWTPGTPFTKPSTTIKLSEELNIVEVWEVIINSLVAGSLTESLDERKNRTKNDKKAWLKSKGLPGSAAMHGQETLTKFVKDHKKGGESLAEELTIFLNTSETNSLDDGLAKVEAKFDDDTIYANPEYVFEDIEDLTMLVGTRKWKSLVVCGMGGVGKCLISKTKIDVKWL